MHQRKVSQNMQKQHARELKASDLAAIEAAMGLGPAAPKFKPSGAEDAARKFYRDRER